MEKKKYLLTIKLEFDAFDDVEARQLAKENLKYMVDYLDPKQEVVKLQNIFENKPPRNIEL
jgi:hypothetical protein